MSNPTPAGKTPAVFDWYDEAGNTHSIPVDGGYLGTDIHPATLHSDHNPSTNITVQEVTLEVPVPHDKLTDTLLQVAMQIVLRREEGIDIPESSRSVTTVGNEVVIRWEEHA